MREVVKFLDDETYNLYQSCIVEKEVKEAQEECEKRHAENIKRLQQQNPSSINHSQLEVDIEVAHISDQLILPRCPQCARQVVDFDACAALKCDTEDGGCGSYICAWCLQAQVAGRHTTARLECHNHVRSCSFNPTKNMYPPSPHPETWQVVMQELARKRVKDYIKKSVSKALQKFVHEECQKKFPEIRLQAFSSKVSDGYRAQQKQRTSRLLGYEENITRLMEMNLATRPRAEQVLEMMQNDLDHAVDFLLAK
jgi:hypothetical protein